MTDLTREQLEALLDGATQGPWQADGEPWNRIVWSSAENRVCFMAHSNGLDDARDIATSNLVAAAPDLARACLDTLTALESAQADLKNRDNQIVDAERLATERLSDIVRLEAENARLRAALAIAGPIALKDYANHPFVLNDEERRNVAMIEAALTPAPEAPKGGEGVVIRAEWEEE